MVIIIIIIIIIIAGNRGIFVCVKSNLAIALVLHCYVL